MAPLPLLPGSTTWDSVPLGTPPTAKVTGPEFPVTVAVIFAGVESCGARAIEEERERLRAPGAPGEPGGLPQAPSAKPSDAEQRNLHSFPTRTPSRLACYGISTN